MAKKLSLDEASHVAKLSKLELTEGELEKFRSQLSEVLSYVSELEKIDTKGIGPTSQTTGLMDVLRADKVLPEELSAEEALSGSSRTHNDYFVVRSVFDKQNE